MNSLDFIDFEIEKIESEIRCKELYVEKNSNNNSFRLEMIKIMMGELSNFYHIKSELIMWKVAKKVLNHFDESLIEGLLIGLYISSEISKDEMQNFKKALEVQNE